MALQLIHDENVKLLAALKSINIKLGKITKGPDLSKPLDVIAKKLDTMNNAGLVAELNSINVTLGTIAKRPELGSALHEIAKKLEEIRSVIDRKK